MFRALSPRRLSPRRPSPRKRPSPEPSHPHKSAVLGWPVWVAQALMVPGFALLAAAGFYMCAQRLRLALASMGTLK